MKAAVGTVAKKEEPEVIPVPPPPPPASNDEIKQEDIAVESEEKLALENGATGSADSQLVKVEGAAGDLAVKPEDAGITSIKSELKTEPSLKQQQQNPIEKIMKPAVMDAASLDAEIAAVAASIVPTDPTLLLRGRHTKDDKVRTVSISLHGLLDYDRDDSEEATVELSLFAELFQDMLAREFGFNIYQALVRQKEISEKLQVADKDHKRKREADSKLSVSASGADSKRSRTDSSASAKAADVSKEPLKQDSKWEEKAGANKKLKVDSILLLAFRYLDRTGCGYIKTDDMRRFLHQLGLDLSYRAVKELALAGQEVSTQAAAAKGSPHSTSDRIYYRDLTDVEISQPVNMPAGSVASHSETGQDKELQQEEQQQHDGGMDHQQMEQQQHDVGMDHQPVEQQQHDGGMDHQPVEQQQHDVGMDHQPVEQQQHDVGMDHQPVEQQQHDVGMD
ncbi:hypothetical protein CEUSTIGMA_g12695.t1, partial [Chlamydomonas eustigma]